MGYININDTLIYCAGKNWQPDQPLILALHGAGGSRLVWEPLQAHLPNVWAIDLPNHGRSDTMTSPTINDYATFISELMTQLPHDNIYLMGHSMGGAIAQQVGLQSPPNIKGLILVATSPNFQVNPSLLEGLKTNLETTIQQINRDSWSREIDPALKAQGETWFRETKLTVLHDDFYACAEFDIKTQLPDIHLPTLVIAGEKDKMVGKDDGRLLASTIPNTSLHTIAGVGHFPQNEAPQAVAQVIDSFINTKQTGSIPMGDDLTI